MSKDFLNMAQFAQTHPPSEPFVARLGPKVVYLHPHVRFQLTHEVTGDIGYGIWREEQLGDDGISGAEIDAQAFAEGLYDTLSDHLSIRNLDRLAEVFARERDKARQERDAAVARMAAHE